MVPPRARVAVSLLTVAPVAAHTGRIVGVVRDETGGSLPGVTIELRNQHGLVATAISDPAASTKLAPMAPAIIS